MIFRTLFKRPVFEEPNEGAGGGEAPPEPGAAPDRISELLARVDRLVQTTEADRARDNARASQIQQQRERESVESLTRKAAEKVDAARTALAKAYEDGDASAIAAAAEQLSAATTERVAAQMQADAYKQRQTAAPQTRQQVDDSNLRRWRDSNKTWYGIDPEMTSAALEIGKTIEAEKVLEVGSVQYFDAIDHRLRQKFPDRLPRTGGVTMQTPRTAVTNSQSQQQTRIPASVAEGYRRMGIDVDNPETAKQLMASRQAAVAKGFLPENPTSGTVIER